MRIKLAALAVGLCLSGVLTLTIGAQRQVSFGDPLPGLTADELARFEEGQDTFDEVSTVETGLGPVFNNVSCVACHDQPARGGGSVVTETRYGRTNSDGAFDPMVEFGGSLVHSRGIGFVGTCNYAGEHVPTEATIRADRRTTPLFGLGLVDAVPDEEFDKLASQEMHLDPNTAGRPNRVMNLVTHNITIGKFGWKAQVPTLLQFSADAYLNEIGVTSPLVPQEHCPQGNCALLACDPTPDPEDDADVQAFADFMMLLAPPARATVRPVSEQGEGVFRAIGCASCHVPRLRTGASEVRALNHVVFEPYSDFLLHDMGSLGDGIGRQGIATGLEMRTAPLWGLRELTTLLHDGRATSIDQAILAHDGQGRAARDRFAALDANRKAALLRFLGSL